MYRHILIASDGSQISGRAVSHAVGLAKALGAQLTAVTATEPKLTGQAEFARIGCSQEEYDAAVTAVAGRILGTISAAAAAEGVACESVHVRNAYPAEAILATAREKGCDLIVLASHGRTGWAKLLAGSESEKVAHQSEIPVLMVR